MPTYSSFEFLELDESRDLEDYGVWCLQAKDCVPALVPMDFYLLAVGAHRATFYGSQTISSPMGVLDWRTKDGFAYISRINLSQEERRRREPIFRENIAPWIEDFGAQWRGKSVPELEGGFQRLKKVDVTKLSDPELRVHFQNWVSYASRNWDVHHLNHYARSNIHRVFLDVINEMLGMDIQHPQLKAMMSGFDNRIFQVDRELYRLGSHALELRLGTLFESIKDDEKLLSELEKSQEGRKWLDEFRQFLDENGWRTARVFDVSYPTWVEKPSLALTAIRVSIAKGGVFALDEEQKRLARQREEVEKDVLSRVPAEKREMFEKLLRAAQWLGVYSEEHIYYCEHYVNGLGRHVLMEIGKRFTRTGVIDEPEDILFLVPEEIMHHIGCAAYGQFSPRKLVEIRKEQYQQNLKAQPPMFIGDVSKVPEVIADEALLLSDIHGVPLVKPELKANLYGSTSAPGIAEGPARVIEGPDEFHLVQPGEILVTVTTSPIWTPLFGMVEGVVTDAGGALTHAIIVGREFGLPVVAGTMEGTRTIKTGDRIRVDGDNCCVYILG